jgi:hypothetical protein
MNYVLDVDYFEIPSEFNARGRPRPRANRVSSKISVDEGAQSCVWCASDSESELPTRAAA